jgi:predicted SAM-dependent methyltransferase
MGTGSRGRWLIDTLTDLIGRFTRRRRVRAAQDPRGGLVKVNLGCGLSVAPGWTNVDASLNALFANLPRFLHPLAYRLAGAKGYYTREQYCGVLANHRFVHHDLAYSLPFEDGAVDFVFSSHFLEHLFRDDARRVLRESFRILKPGGTMRVCVPDLGYAISLYGSGRTREMLEEYFFVDVKSSYLARHKYMYDFAMLAEELRSAGFGDVTRCRYREGRTPDIERLDNYPEITLYVEARRPPEVRDPSA